MNPRDWIIDLTIILGSFTVIYIYAPHAWINWNHQAELRAKHNEALVVWDELTDVGAALKQMDTGVAQDSTVIIVTDYSCPYSREVASLIRTSKMPLFPYLIVRQTRAYLEESTWSAAVLVCSEALERTRFADALLVRLWDTGRQTDEMERHRVVERLFHDEELHCLESSETQDRIRTMNELAWGVDIRNTPTAITRKRLLQGATMVQEALGPSAEGRGRER